MTASGVPLPRLAARHLAAGTSVMPVVVVMGARQSGKSTLVQTHPDLAGRPYVTLDSADARAQGRAAPYDLLRRAPRMTIDEVQRDPELILALKAVIDQQDRRVPGQFVLTGSANLLSMRRVQETLAGRAVYMPLWPMTRREQLGFGTAGMWGDLLATPCTRWDQLLADSVAPEEDWRDLARRGGYPTPATDLPTPAARALWFQGYVNTYLDRDVRDLMAVASALDLRRLMRVACLRVGQLVNRAEWARDASVTPTTAFRYLDLLETSYQLVRVEAYAVNRTKRVIKAAKGYWADVGLSLHLAGNPPLTGFHLENVVLCDLVAWRDAEAQRPAVMHWRTSNQEEVDFVVEAPDGRLLAVECKATERPGYGDTVGLRLFLREYPDAVGGLLLHGGAETFWAAERVLATPWWRVV